MPIIRTLPTAPPTLQEILESATHLYLLNQESGGDLKDLNGSLNLSNTGLIPAAANSPFFGKGRPFNGTDQYAVTETNLTRGAQPFALAVGLRFTEVTGSDGICGESSYGVTDQFNYYLARSSAGIRFYVRRKNTTTSTDYAEVTGLEAGKDYIIFARCDGTTLHLSISSLGETIDNASLFGDSNGFDTIDRPFCVGYAPFSAVAASAHMKGSISFVAQWNGHVPEAYGIELLKTLPADWLNYHRRNRIFGIGDSLFTESYTAPSVLGAIATLVGNGMTSESAGVGGQTSTPIADRFTAIPTSNLNRDTIAIWIGNNNPSQIETVIADTERCINHALASNPRLVLVFGLPNRSFTNATTETIANLQAQLDAIKAGVIPLTGISEKVHYIDVHEWFTNADNYTGGDYSLTANDLTDIAAGIVPRGLRDTPASPSSTHLGAPGRDHLAIPAANIIIA